LDGYYASADVEVLPMPYASFHQHIVGPGVTLVTARSGNLAQAVGKSMANPLIFSRLDIRTQADVDPGLDRVAATPIEDTCKAFPLSRILAINVTGAPAFYQANLPCPVLEIRITPSCAFRASRSPVSGDDDRAFRASRSERSDAGVLCHWLRVSFRREGPFSTSRWARLRTRSQMASATVGSARYSCQCFGST
jgi:hypothetical protein